MESRRSLLIKSAAAVTVLSLGSLSCSHFGSQRAKNPLKTKEPRKALVLWFSQMGYTERYGKLIARRLEMAGLAVDSGEIRRMEPSLLPSYDLIVFGSPVYHYNIPPNVKHWLDKTPSIDGLAVAAYVSFGGPEGNQYNAACSILEPLTKRGGIPMGLAAFMNIATFPFPDWKGPGIQEHMHLPDEGTYNQVRAFTAAILDRIRQDTSMIFSRRFTLRESLTVLPLIGFTKWYTGKHAIDQAKCIHCGNCVAKCPVNAISISKGIIDRDRCIACFGCFNNCPTGAMEMEMGGKKIYGFNKFREQQKIVVREPVELRALPAAS